MTDRKEAHAGRDNWQKTDPDTLVFVGHRTTMGVAGLSPEEKNVAKGLDPRAPVELRAWPRSGRFYMAGLRTVNVNGDNLHLRVLHPRSKEPMFQGDAWRLNPDADPDTDLMTHEGMFMRIWAAHAEGEPDPVYCSEQEPLLIEAVGSVPVNLVVFGSDYYEFIRLPGQGDGHVQRRQ